MACAHSIGEKAVISGDPKTGVKLLKTLLPGFPSLLHLSYLSLKHNHSTSMFPRMTPTIFFYSLSQVISFGDVYSVLFLIDTCVLNLRKEKENIQNVNM